MMPEFSKENSVVTKLSVSASFGNLTHLKHKNVSFLAIHDSEKISLTSISSGKSTNKELVFETNCEDNRYYIQQLKLVLLQEKPYLIAVSSKTLKVFTVGDNPLVVFTYSLQTDNKLGQMVHSVQRLSKSVLAIGTQFKIHFISVNSNGNNFKAKEFHQEFKSSSKSLIYSLASNEQSQLAVAENIGIITLWKFDGNQNFSKLNTIEIHPNTKCTNIQLYKNLLILVTVSGQIQLVNMNNGELQCEVQAHVKSITAFDITSKLDLFVTASEDSRVRVFRLKQTSDDNFIVEHLIQITINNEMICGAKFLDTNGEQLAITTYESCNIKMFRLTY